MYDNDHPVCAASEASRLFLTGAATPPVPGGEPPVLAIHSYLHKPPLKEFATRLHAHVADGVAPVAVVGGAADGAHVNAVRGTGRQTAEKHRPRPRKQAAFLPGARRTVRSDRRLLQFVRPGVKHLLHVYPKLAGVAVIDDRDGRLRQWQLCTDGRGGLEPAREQRG